MLFGMTDEETPEVGSLLKTKSLDELIYEQEYGKYGISAIIFKDNIVIDHYIQIPYNFKGLMFLGTANENSFMCDYYEVLFEEKKCWIQKHKVALLEK
jgi:hypothetical protein